MLSLNKKRKKKPEGSVSSNFFRRQRCVSFTSLTEHRINKILGEEKREMLRLALLFGEVDLNAVLIVEDCPRTLRQIRAHSGL